MEEGLLALILGGMLGWRERKNDDLVDQGITPPWSARHPILSFGLGCVFWFVVFIGALLAYVALVAVNVWFYIITPVVVIGAVSIWRYRVAERRWNRAVNQPTKAVSIRRV